MTQFLSQKNRTPEYVEAVSALQRLLEAGNSATVTSAYAEAVAEQHLETWAQTRGVKRSKGRQCINRLIGKQCGSYRYYHHDCFPPYGDHCSLWLKDGKPFVFVSQPYGFSWQCMQETVEYCLRNGLEVDIDTWPSWHFPGRVLSLIYRKAGAER